MPVFGESSLFRNVLISKKIISQYQRLDSEGLVTGIVNPGRPVTKWNDPVPVASPQCENRSWKFSLCVRILDILVKFIQFA